MRSTARSSVSRRRCAPSRSTPRSCAPPWRRRARRGPLYEQVMQDIIARGGGRHVARGARQARRLAAARPARIRAEALGRRWRDVNVRRGSVTVGKQRRDQRLPGAHRARAGARAAAVRLPAHGRARATAAVVDVPPAYRAGGGKAARGAAGAGLVARLPLARTDRRWSSARISTISTSRPRSRASSRPTRTTRIAGAPLLPLISFDGIGDSAPGTGADAAARQLQRGAQCQLRDRFLGQEPRGAARGRVRRDRQPLRSRGDRALDGRDRRQHLFPGARRAGPAAHRARQRRRRRRASSRSIQDRIARRHRRAASTSRSRNRCVAQQRASIPPLDQQLRQNIATLAVLLGEAPERLTVRGGSLDGDRAAARRARPAVRPAAAAPRHPRGGGAACRRRRQRRERARGAVSEHLADRAGRLRQRRAEARCSSRSRRSTRSPASVTQPIFDGFRLLSQLDLQKGAPHRAACSSTARPSSRASPTSSAR